MTKSLETPLIRTGRLGPQAANAAEVVFEVNGLSGFVARCRLAGLRRASAPEDSRAASRARAGAVRVGIPIVSEVDRELILPSPGDRRPEGWLREGNREKTVDPPSPGTCPGSSAW
jgi:hypothetical protein